ncbi:MAG: hypothetical protein HY679_01150 [Chloroflexi bacterium]|nr:hypothetical protein [Chloroflexota bacterium]
MFRRLVIAISLIGAMGLAAFGGAAAGGVAVFVALRQNKTEAASAAQAPPRRSRPRLRCQPRLRRAPDCAPWTFNRRLPMPWPG